MGVLGVTNSKAWDRRQTANPIGTKFGIRLRIHLGMGICKNVDPQDHMGIWVVLGGQQLKNQGRPILCCNYPGRCRVIWA